MYMGTLIHMMHIGKFSSDHIGIILFILHKPYSVALIGTA